MRSLRFQDQLILGSPLVVRGQVFRHPADGLCLVSDNQTTIFVDIVLDVFFSSDLNGGLCVAS